MADDSNTNDVLSESRRRALRAIGGVGTIAIAGCTGDGSDGGDGGTGGDGGSGGDGGDGGDGGSGGDGGDGGSQEMTDIHTIDSEDTHAATTFLWGKDQGFWRDRGINLSVEFASFGKFVRAVNDDLSEISGLSLPPQMNFINEGSDLVILGGQLPWIQVMFGKNETVESMDGPADLDDKVLGLPPESTTGSNGIRSLFLDEFDYDVFEDPKETRFAAPSALWNLLLDDEIDVTLLFTGGTIRGLAHDDVATVFHPSEYWTENIADHSPTLAGWTVERGWLEENADVALGFLEAWAEAVEAQAENPDPSIRDYGRLIGLDTEAKQDVLRTWLTEGTAFQDTDYTQDMIDNDYRFMEMLQEVGAFDELPPKDEVFMSRDELRDIAEDS